MTIHFVLSHPAVPENIGFATRAINTMGFARLRLVNPCDHLSTQAKKTAYGSHDILENALVFPTLKEALTDMDISIATTAKKRLARHDNHSPQALAGMLAEKHGVAANVAIVFGSERDGLSKEEVNLCDLVSTIPLAAPHPSLNLAQSVLIYAWELSKLSAYPNGDVDTSGEEVGGSEQKLLRQTAFQLLDDLDVPRQPSLYHRLKDRLMTANADDTRLMLALARFLRQKLSEKK